jgi:hypothetical protein
MRLQGKREKASLLSGLFNQKGKIVGMRGVALIVGVLVAGALVAGCGSGGNEETVRKAAFSRQADGVCLKVNKEAAAELKKAYESPPLSNVKTEAEGIRGEVTVLVPILITQAEAASAGLGKLEAPEGDRSSIDSLQSAYADWIKKAKATPLRIVIANDIFNRARKQAVKYGLAKCGATPFDIL